MYVIHTGNSLYTSGTCGMVSHEFSDQDRGIDVSFRGGTLFTELTCLYEQFRDGRDAIGTEERKLQSFFKREGKLKLADELLK